MKYFINLFPTTFQYRKWTLPTKWSFWSAVVGIPSGLMGLVALVFTIFPLISDSQRDLHSLEFFKAAQELRYNREYLSTLSTAIKSNAYQLPPGSIKAVATLQLFDKHFELITRFAHGEQKHLYQLSLKLKDLGDQISRASKPFDLKNSFAESEFSLDDVMFLNEFLLWYLMPTIEEKLSNEQKRAFGPLDMPGSTFIASGTKALNLRYFQNDGKPITEFVDYLGLID
jgi:hypothetical protein